MDLSREGFFCKVESLVSTLCEVVWWAAIFPSPAHYPKEVPTDLQHPPVGLKALTAAISGKETSPKLKASSGVVHSYNVSSAPTLSKLSSCSWSPSSSSSSSLSLPRFLLCPSSMRGDLIGTESGVYMSSDEDLVTAAAGEKSKPYSIGKEIQEPSPTERKYPPPIPLLAGTGNLVAHMPWVLTRKSTSDGKLIITEERCKYLEYFEAKREHGRLLLSLVSLGDDDDDDDDDKDEQMEEEEEEEDLYFMEGIQRASEKDTESDQVLVDDFNIYDDDRKGYDDDEKEKKPSKIVMQKGIGSTTMFASSMPEMIPPVNMIHEKSRFGRRCLTFVDSSNMFRFNNIVYT